MPFVLGRKTRFVELRIRGHWRCLITKRSQTVSTRLADLQRLVQHHIGQDVSPTHDPFGAKASSDAADA